MAQVKASKTKTLNGRRIAIALLAVIVVWLVASVPHWLRVFHAVQTYIYGYPLVTMGITKDVMTAPELQLIPSEKRKLGAGAANQFSHVRRFPDPHFKEVVAPNADTLYSIAWLDLSAGPLVLHMPDMHGRWVLMEVLDGWTNAYASLGTRQYGGGPRDYLITGPGWQGTVPTGMVHVASPTRIGWIIGRTYTRDEVDFASVHRVQDQYLLEPFQPDARPAPTSPQALSTSARVDVSTPPVRQLARMDARTFYTHLMTLLVDNPPTSGDGAMLRNMQDFGLTVSSSWRWDALDPQAQATLQEGLEISRGLLEGFAPGTQGEIHLSAFSTRALALVAHRLRNAALQPVNGWGISTRIGVYGTNYPLRALVTLLGLGANIAADAVYPITTTDANGDGLDGHKRYVLHFTREQIPPAAAFWSLTMYDSESFFVDNPIHRYAIGDRNPLKFNDDGSLDIWLQSEPPGAGKLENWLPAPVTPFRLMMRLYDPKPEVLNGQWKPPAPQLLP